MSLKFTAGDLTIHRIIEQETAFLSALEMLPTLTPEVLAENRAWMQAASALDAKDVLVLCFQSYIVKTPHHTILIDSCIGNDKPRPQRPKWNMKTDDTYMRALAAAGLSVGDIDYVMCTHLHVDHVGWNTRLENGRWVPTFPNARHVFGKTEFDYWMGVHAKTPVPVIEDSVMPIVEAKRFEVVGNDHQIGDHVRIVPTPGHTPGHSAFALGRGKDDAVFSGDLIHSPIQARYPEMSMKFDVDQAEAAKTRRSFLERYCDTDTLCCTAHFPSPSVGKIGARTAGFPARRCSALLVTSPLRERSDRIDRCDPGEGEPPQVALNSRRSPHPTLSRAGRGRVNQTNSACGSPPRLRSPASSAWSPRRRWPKSRRACCRPPARGGTAPRSDRGYARAPDRRRATARRRRVVWRYRHR